MGIVRYVTNKLSDDKFVRCESCGKIIAQSVNEEMDPLPGECYKNGNVPVPNLGWFCSQECAGDFEKKYNVTFARTKEGKIDYWA